MFNFVGWLAPAIPRGVAALVEGMDIDEAIKRLKGIKCGPRPTSCPDQLATALEQYKAQQ